MWKANTKDLSLFWGLFFPFLLWMVFTPFSSQIDLEVSRYFFQDGTFSDHPFWKWVFHYAIFPGWAMVGMALFGIALSAVQSYRGLFKPCLYLVLTLAIGSGLIIHWGLKDHWGRPRPRQVNEFQGTQTFQPYYRPNFERKGEHAKSFSCGHCSMGFYFFSLALLGRIYRARKIFLLGMFLAVLLGFLLSIARIAQGGHFFSDTFATALIMWWTAWILAFSIFQRDEDERTDAEAA